MFVTLIPTEMTNKRKSMKRFLIIMICIFSILLSCFKAESPKVEYKAKCKECKNPNESHWL